MTFTAKEYLSKIDAHLATIVFQIELNSLAYLTDDNKLAEDFFCGLLNIAWDTNLINLNEIKPNYPGIDLGDTESKICVQITTTGTNSKVQHTIDVCKDKNHSNTYEKLVFLAASLEDDISKEFDHGFEEFEIYNVQKLKKEISKIIDIDKLKKFLDYLEKWHSTNIVLPEELTDEDIKKVLTTISNYLFPQEITVSLSDLEHKIPERNSIDYVEQKNVINSISPILFNKSIKPSIKYAKEIDQFLLEDLNIVMRKKYLEIVSKIKENTNMSIEEYFGKIFAECIDFNNAEISTKLRIVMSYMYFNCDIGKNPTDI